MKIGETLRCSERDAVDTTSAREQRPSQAALQKSTPLTECISRAMFS